MVFEEQFEMNIRARELMESAGAEWEELHRLILEEAWIEEPNKKGAGSNERNG